MKTLIDYAMAYIEDRLASLRRQHAELTYENAELEKQIALLEQEFAAIVAEATAAQPRPRTLAEALKPGAATPSEVIPPHIRTTRAGDVIP